MTNDKKFEVGEGLTAEMLDRHVKQVSARVIRDAQMPEYWHATKRQLLAFDTVENLRSDIRELIDTLKADDTIPDNMYFKVLR